MSYEVLGETDSLGQFASHAGYRRLIAAAANFPALKQLFVAGVSSDIPTVIAELNRIKSPSDAKRTAQGLAAMICGRKCIVISDCLTDWEAAGREASKTAKWAVTMTKVRIRQVLSRTRWQLVEFLGKGGRESVGVVDLLAIRKDHRVPRIAGTKRGDALQVILIQVKGGGAANPTSEDGKRLWAVAKRINAQEILLATWKKGAAASFSRYHPQATVKAHEWTDVSDLEAVFR